MSDVKPTTPPPTPPSKDPARAGTFAQIGLALSVLFFGGVLAAPIAFAIVVLLVFGFTFTASVAIRQSGTFGQTAFAQAAFVSLLVLSAGALYLHAHRAAAWLAKRTVTGTDKPAKAAPWSARHPWITLAALAGIPSFILWRMVPTGEPALQWVADISVLTCCTALCIGVAWAGARYTFGLLRGLFRFGRGSSYRAGLLTGITAFCALTTSVAPRLLLPSQQERVSSRSFPNLRRIAHAVTESGSAPDRERRFLYRLSMLGAAGPSTPTRATNLAAAAWTDRGDEMPPANIGRGGGFGGDGFGGGGFGGGDGGDFDACIRRLMLEEDKVRRDVSPGYSRVLSEDDIFDAVREALIAVCQKHEGRYLNVVGAFVQAARNRLTDRVKGGHHFYETACDMEAAPPSIRQPTWMPEETRLESERKQMRALWCRLSDAEREVVASRLVDDMSFAEIAEQMGITERQARDRYTYAIKRLGVWWQQAFPDGN